MKKSKGLSLRENADSTKRESAPPADPAGGVQWDTTYYPWGQVWQQGGTRQSAAFAGLDWRVNDPLIPSATRELSPALGRWLTPDPLGGDVTNPQSLNRYAYVLNNPTTLTDPLGLQSGDFDPRACQDPAYADSHAECQGPGSDYCSQFPYSPECSGYPGGGIGGVGSGGNRPAPPGAPPAGQPPLAGMGNAMFGGLITCTYTQVTIGGVLYPQSPTACVLAALASLGGVTAAWNYFKKTPFTFSVTEGIALQLTWIPATKTVCGAYGAGFAVPTKAISFGTYIHGDLNNPVPVLEGWSWNVSYQPEPALGYQTTWNSSGSLGGASFSGPGVSVSRTKGTCGQFPWLP